MSNLIQAAKDQIAALTAAAYQAAAEKGLLPPGLSLGGTIEIPKDTAHGDYATNVALTAAKTMKRNPREIGQLMLDHLDLSGSYFASAELAGAGFLNFHLSPRWYGAVLKDIEQEGLSYGQLDVGSGTRVMVEFVSANPTGTMTIGNARGGVLGDALASILERAGYDVWREFYVNDAGNQVHLFGRSLEARYLQLLYGEDACAFPEDGYHGEDIWDTARLFLSQHGDKYAKAEPEARQAALRAFGLAHNIEKMRTDLERYGIRYDCWFRESALHESGYVDETVQLLIDKGFTYEKDDALWLKVTELGGEKDEVLRRGGGGYTYFAVDIAYHRNKFEVRGFDRVIDVLGADHHGHALRFQKAITALGVDSSRLNFLIMQLVRLVRDGETVKVSKRSGKSITLSDLLDEISKDAARFFFNSKPTTHLEFDMGLALRQDSENPVYYVQYAHARICSLVETLKDQGDAVCSAGDIDVSLLSTPVEQALIKTLAQLPEEIRLAARDYDPSRINRYLVALAGGFHRFYNANRIKDEAPALLHARLKLADTVRSVLENGLSLIGVTAPEKM